MKTNEMKHAVLDSVLLDFRLEAADAPNPDVLDVFCRKYPQYARELTDYALQWLLDEVVDAAAAVDEIEQQVSSTLVSRSISRFHDRIADRTSTQEQTNEQSNPFEDLSVQRKREIRDRLGIDLPLFAKFQNRLIDPDTTTHRFLERLSEELRHNVEQLIRYLHLPPILHTQADYKSMDKPSVSSQKETFEQAVMKSSLEDKQKQELLKD